MENLASEEKGDDAYTQDGTVSLHGSPVLRSKTGRWTACSFIVGYEVFERMAYYGIATNLVVYLGERLHEGTVQSSNNVTNWAGTVWILPILGAYIADARLGRFWTFVFASAIYLSGMILLTLAVSIPGLKPPRCPESDPGCNIQPSALQKGIFYLALYIIAIGTGGTKPNISTMGADQFDEFEPKERTHKLSFFNWWMFSIFFGTLFSNTFLIYLQDRVGWTLGYGLPTVGLGISIVVFLIGTPMYRHKLPVGSPFTKMAQVLAAAARNWNVELPDDPKELYELGPDEYEKLGKFPVDHSPSLRIFPCRFLDKAAARTATTTSPWHLTPVTQVEETKQMLKMLPILAITILPSAIVAQSGTLFIKQGSTMDRSMGPNFEIPAACLAAFVTIFMLISLVIYDRWFVPFIKHFTGNPRGITLLQRMGIGLILQILVMVSACLAERKRLETKLDRVPLTIFILMPQFALLGIADCFMEVAKLELFYDQAPEGMKSLGTSYFTSSIGLGHFLSSFLVKLVANVSARNGRKGWILNNLNVSHLDYYYGLLAVLGLVNLVVFFVVAKLFVYNVVHLESRSNGVAVKQLQHDDSDDGDEFHKQ
ncbi:Protein NRT1/ PTR FAMILY 5.2 [Linum perenne]